MIPCAHNNSLWLSLCLYLKYLNFCEESTGGLENRAWIDSTCNWTLICKPASVILLEQICFESSWTDWFVVGRWEQTGPRCFGFVLNLLFWWRDDAVALYVGAAWVTYLALTYFIPLLHSILWHPQWWKVTKCIDSSTVHFQGTCNSLFLFGTTIYFKAMFMV